MLLKESVSIKIIVLAGKGICTSVVSLSCQNSWKSNATITGSESVSSRASPRAGLLESMRMRRLGMQRMQKA